MDSAQMVEQGTILRATVGSTVHGLHHGGQDDRDEMAVYIEPPAYLIGLARARAIRGGLYGFEHYVERTQPEGVRSGPGDLDLNPADIVDALPTLREAREQSERRLIVNALVRSRGNISRAARVLDISRPTFHDMLDKHSIDAKEFR